MALYPPLWMQEQTYPALLDRLFIQDALGPAPVLLSGAGALAATQRAAGANMSVDVAPGRALIPGTDAVNQGCYTVWSDAVVNVPIATAPGAGQSRIDLIVARVQDDFVIGGGNSNFVIVPVQGTAANTGSQVAPAAPNSSMVIAQVTVGPNVTSIVTANIADMRPYSRSGSTQLVVSRPLPSLVTGGSPYLINHNLGTTSIIVQIWDTVTNQQVLANVTIVDANNIQVAVTTSAPNPVNVVIMGTAAAPTTVVPSNLATVQYVQQQMTQSYSFSYMQTLLAPTVAGSPYSVTHNLNTANVFVECWDAVTQQLVFTQVNIVDVNHISITVAQNMPNNINVVVMGVGNAPLPLAPSNFATRAYVDAKTATLPAPVTSGSGVQSFTDALGDVWVAANGVRGGNWYRARDVVYARIHRAAALTTAANAATNIPYDTATWDTYGLATTLGVSAGITCPVPGIYTCTFALHLQGGGATRMYSYIVNSRIGSMVTTDYQPAAAVSWLMSGTTLFLCQAGDILRATYMTTTATVCYVGQNDCYMTMAYLGTG